MYDGAMVGALLSTTLLLAAGATAPPKPKPLMRDFIGLNVHTVQFKPDLYRPVARRLRDYHGFDWDVGDDTSYVPRYPMARNGVDWQKLYGTWKEKGFTTSVCLQFDGILPPKWKNLPRDAEAFGRTFARYFGPSHQNLVECIEVGNEPGKYSDADYRTLLQSVGRGVRQGDPKLKVATCATFDKPSGEYHKSLEAVRGLEPFYDIVNLHAYPQAEGWPTWRRSFPEDPKIEFLREIQSVIAWRDRHAPGKEVWLTEFGWDASTQTAPGKEGERWVGVTDEQQAQYIVRAYLTLATMDLDRAYLFWFNDEDAPTLHGASGLTRRYVPKPSFHALAHLQRTLGDFRLSRVVLREPGETQLLEFRHERDPKRLVWAAWSPTGSGRKAPFRLPRPPGKVQSVETMPLGVDPAPKTTWKAGRDGTMQVTVTESPIYIGIRRR